jgi:aminoglycoside phosphotransferase (APT) family kinase protein
VARVADWLQRNRPGAGTPAILHGDFHLGSLLYSRGGPQVAAVVDWEMCTIGDPLLGFGLVAGDLA